MRPDPKRAIDREYPEPTRSLAAKNMQLMTEGKVLLVQNRPTTEAAYKPRDDPTRSGESQKSRLATRFGVFGTHSHGRGSRIRMSDSRQTRLDLFVA